MTPQYQQVMDGRIYRLRVKFPDLSRSFRIPDGPNAGEMLSGDIEPDSKGTYYDYEMSVEPHPQYPTDYDEFYEAISDPKAIHTILVPYGQGTKSLQIRVTSGTDYTRGKLGGIRRWSGLKVRFTAVAPSRRAT